MADQFNAFEKSLFKSTEYYENVIKLHEMIYISYIGRDKT